MTAISTAPSYTIAIQQRLLASHLLQHGLQLSLTKAITQVPHSEVRKIYVELYGQKPRPGKTPESVMHFITSDQDNLCITLAALIYVNLTEESSRYQIDPLAMIKAFEIAREFIPSLRINALFYCARDYKEREYHFHHCPTCETHYVSHNNDHSNQQCPACSTTGHLTLSAIKAIAKNKAALSAPQVAAAR
ncbi:MAG: hypothetical protein E6Q76_07375 [Rhizobium sp.]|nr:MAG: hypothetical protein E6Q76_07375 [Rhizobium sp.]